MDQKEYLDDDFDPKSYKVAQLRNVLNEYEVEFSSSAKKSDLVKLFNEHIFSKRKALLKKYNDALQDVNDDAFLDYTAKDEIDNSNEAPKKKTAKNSKNKSRKAKSSKQVVEDVKEHEDDIISSKESTPFSQENIFQSPPSGSRRRKRKVTDESENEAKSDKKLKIGGLFDDEDDIDNFHKEVLKSFTPRKVKKQDNDSIGTPNKLASRSNISTPKLNSIDQELETSKTSTPVPQEDILKEVLPPPKVELMKLKGSLPVKSPISPKLKASLKEKTPASPKGKTPVSPKGKTPTSPEIRQPSSPAAKLVTDDSANDVSNSPLISLTKSTPKNTKTRSSPRQASSVRFSPPTETNKKFQTLEEETEDFDKFAKKSNTKNLDVLPHAGVHTPEKSKPKVVLTPGPKLTPKPRKTVFDKIQEKTTVNTEEESSSSDSEDEEKEQEDDVVNVDVEGNEEIKTRPTFKYFFIYTFLWIFLSLTGIFGHWYSEQTVLIGYCGHSIDEPTFFNPDSPFLNKLSEYLDTFKPQCVKCPSHARCFEYLEIGCFEDFIESKPWYFDIAPFINPQGKKCIPDTKKAEKLESMIEYSLDLLRSKNAMINCGTGQDNLESGISKDELYEIMLSMKAPYITIEEFDELWERSVIELEKEPEIITELPDDNISTHLSSDHKGYEKEAKNQIFRSTSLQNINLKCQLQNTLILTLYANKEYIIGVMILAVILILMKLQYDEIQSQKYKINGIYEEVIDRLKAQKTQPINYIGANQLRDLILPIDNLKYKLKLWNAVSKKIEKNSNVTYKTIEHHGDIIKVWEWVSHFDD